MTRYILIDHHTGYIWGDSYDFNATPTDYKDAARLLDESLGDGPYKYEYCYQTDIDKTYDVYDADDGLVITDGQDQDQIDAVLEHSRFINSVRRIGV